MTAICPLCLQTLSKDGRFILYDWKTKASERQEYMVLNRTLCIKTDSTRCVHPKWHQLQLVYMSRVEDKYRLVSSPWLHVLRSTLFSFYVLSKYVTFSKINQDSYTSSPPIKTRKCCTTPVRNMYECRILAIELSVSEAHIPSKLSPCTAISLTLLTLFLWIVS